MTLSTSARRSFFAAAFFLTRSAFSQMNLTSTVFGSDFERRVIRYFIQQPFLLG